MRGFTMLEMMLVVAVSVIIAALTVPVGVRFLQIQNLDEAAADAMAALRRARSQAVSQRHDSAFGVKFLSGSYVLFQGASYAARVQSEDESFTMYGGAAVSGLDEVAFAKLTGLPSAVGLLTVSSGGDSRGIVINAQGNIERQ
ncbi:prepilin-type N-terminal cleavage/methylation domain-containing protein [Candidatus Uhrbacteria bacterium]|nr:prepilin-type N-terminal cleavage/methylation domain-containing protein [Candidatus Uhrbacteria bacterium]